MTSNQYLILAYIAGLTLLWGYAIVLWVSGTKLGGRERGGT
jgi:hypothetical protein